MIESLVMMFFVDKSALGKSHLICLFKAVMYVFLESIHIFVCCVWCLLFLHVASMFPCYLSEGLVCVPMAHIGFGHFSLSSFFFCKNIFHTDMQF